MTRQLGRPAGPDPVHRRVLTPPVTIRQRVPPGAPLSITWRSVLGALVVVLVFALIARAWLLVALALYVLWRFRAKSS